MSSSTRASVVMACHGGGPMPVLGDPGHKELIQSMRSHIPKILRLGTPAAPRAIVVVTAHWSASQPTISNAESHSLLYDYGGFPKEAYALKYPAPGSPQVADEVAAVLREAGFEPKMDGKRGWDHGVFIPMLLINPQADIPIVQLSVLNSASPAEHFRMGQALGKLRDSNVAILGSGMPTMHNLPAMFSAQAGDGGFRKRNKEWSDRLNAAVSIEKSEERGKALEGWRDWIGSKEAHPVGGEEHFLPLIVCAGAGGDGKGGAFSNHLMGFDHWSYYWE